MGIYCLLNGNKTRLLPLPMPMLMAFIEFARSLLFAKGSMWKKNFESFKIRKTYVLTSVSRATSDSGVEVID